MKTCSRTIPYGNAGNNHYAWKGDSVQYRQAHAWVRTYLIKQHGNFCSKCGSTKRVEIANTTVDHKCSRNPADYILLCKKCHNEYDGVFNNLKQGIDAINNSIRRNPQLTSKRCTKCGIEKPLEDFYKESRDRLYRSECKECTKLAHKLARVEIR